MRSSLIFIASIPILTHFWLGRVLGYATITLLEHDLIRKTAASFLARSAAYCSVADFFHSVRLCYANSRSGLGMVGIGRLNDRLLA